MNQFIAKYQGQLNGVLSGFDRIVFRGALGLNHEAGMKGYISKPIRVDELVDAVLADYASAPVGEKLRGALQFLATLDPGPALAAGQPVGGAP